MSRRLFRSVLFIPTDRPKAMEKAVFELQPDVAILDLEDAVSPQNKSTARENLQNFTEQLLFSGKPIKSQIVVRINCPLTTPWGDLDLQALKDSKTVDRLLIPKVDDEIVVRKILSSHSSRPLWTMIETSKGVTNVNQIASIKEVETLVFGANDLSKDLNISNLTSVFPNLPQVLGTVPLWYSMSNCIAAGRANGKVIIDGVYMDINNEEGFKESCRFGRSMGFSGKSLIHPNQVKPCNQVFSPSEKDVSHARRVLSAYEDSTNQGRSLAVLDGKLIELLHVEQAKEVLAMHEATRNTEI